MSKKDIIIDKLESMNAAKYRPHTYFNDEFTYDQNVKDCRHYAIPHCLVCNGVNVGDIITEANYKAIEGIFENSESFTFKDEVIVSIDKLTEDEYETLLSVLNGLENYPLIDEDIYSELEVEWLDKEVSDTQILQEFAENFDDYFDTDEGHNSLYWDYGTEEQEELLHLFLSFNPDCVTYTYYACINFECMFNLSKRNLLELRKNETFRKVFQIELSEAEKMESTGYTPLFNLNQYNEI